MLHSLTAQSEDGRIAAAIQEAEKLTDAEIVVVVAPRSDAYGGWRAAGALLLATVVALGLYEWVPALDAGWLLLGYLPAAAIFFVLLGWRYLLMPLVPDAVEIAAVRRAAGSAFVEHGVYTTSVRGGVLLYLSELEHRVELIADVAADRALGHETWQKVVDHLGEGLRAGEGADAVVHAVAELGRLLAEPFPPTAEGGELADAVRR